MSYCGPITRTKPEIAEHSENMIDILELLDWLCLYQLVGYIVAKPSVPK